MRENKYLPIKRTTALYGLLAAFTCLGLQPGSASAQTRKPTIPPNFVFFLVDDLGWTDINCTEGPNGQSYSNPGGEYDSGYYYTPNIARLRNEGLRFTNAYASCPFCGPSRASMLTGKYPARIGFTNNNTHDQTQGQGPFKPGEMKFTEPVEPALVRSLDPRKETLLPRALKTPNSDHPGYLSCTIGKWHVYQEGTVGCYPESHGFDFAIGGTFRGAPGGINNHGKNYYKGKGWDPEYYPHLNDARTFYAPDWPLSSDKNGNKVDDDFEELDYLTDALTYRALEFVELANNQSKPFFLYIPHYGVHTPSQARRSDTNGNGVIDVNDTEVDAAFFEGRRGRDARHEIDPPADRGEYQTRYTYASMIKSVDESLGRILDKLDRLGLAENTYVIFCSDNGGVERNGITSNDPLRSEKTHGYEGGTRVAFIIRGPGVAKNGTCDVPITGPDFFPTILELAGISLEDVEKASTNGFSKKDIDGVSLVSLLDGDSSGFSRENDPADAADNGAIYWHVPHYKHSAPYSAVLRDQQKFMRYWEDGESLKNRPEPEDGYFLSEKELYDLSSNIGEEGDKNLCQTAPSLAKDLENTLYRWLASVDAIMPTAVKRTNKTGETQRWYSNWIVKNEPSLAYTNPIQAAVNEAVAGDKITVYPGDYLQNVDFSKLADQATVQSIDPSNASIAALTQIKGQPFMMVGPTGNSASGAQNNKNPTARKTENIRYSYDDTLDESHLCLDVYSPEQANHTPVMVYVHGGGWHRGDKGQLAVKPRFFNELGWTFVSVNYRLLPEASVLTQALDCAKAVAWVHSHIQEFGGDPQRIHLMGHSAGAHLVGILGTNEEFLNGVGLNLRTIKSVTVLDIPMDILLALKNKQPAFVDAFDTNPEIWKRLSPLHNINKWKSIPPYLLVLADDIEARRPYSVPFQKALIETGGSCTLVEMPNHNHGATSQKIGVPGDPMTSAVTGFLKSIGAIRD